MADVIAPPPARTRRRVDERGIGAGTPRTRFGLRALVIVYLGILVLVPIGVLTYRAWAPGWANVHDTLTDPDTIHAIELTLVIVFYAVVINTVFGVATALLLTRFEFPGKRLLNTFIDLPVAISPIVVGLALVLVFGDDGWFGSALGSIGLQVIYSTPGMVLATTFVSLPLVVRAVMPVLEQAGIDQEQAARSLGAGAITTFRRITLPTIRSALVYGVVLSLARCLGEYGAVLVVSGNVQGQTETATLRIDNYFESSLEPDKAYALTFVMIAAALLAILAITVLRRKQVQ